MQNPTPTDWRARLESLKAVHVTSSIALRTIVSALERADVVALDIETYGPGPDDGLDPRKGSIRLLTLATETGCWALDCKRLDRVDVLRVLDVLREKTVVAFNALFDLGFLRVHYGWEPGRVDDPIVLSRLLDCGLPEARRRGYHTLAAVATRFLGVELEKEEQKADWGGRLTDSMLRYSGRDAAVLLPLRAALWERIEAENLREVAEIELRSLPAMVWLAQSGVPFDAGCWETLGRDAEAALADLTWRLNETAPRRPGTLDLGQDAGWNWNSDAQVKEAFSLLGVSLDDTQESTLAVVEHPLAALLLEYRGVAKLLSSYGKGWLKREHQGRVYPAWRPQGTDSGRMSCADPNVQQMPRDPRYRACIRAPEGRVLVKADYSQIELRLAAKIARERKMQAAYQRGEDLHRLTASHVLGKPLDEVTKEDRQLAKAVNFGLLYGMGAAGFRTYARTSYGVALTAEEAQEYRERFFEAYPALRRWHRGQMTRRSEEPELVEVRTLTGRRRWLKSDEFTQRVNTPVQGTGADGLKAALALLWERRHECPGALPVIACHDEIVIECAEEQAEAAAAWLRQAMLDGMAPLCEPVPVEVETQIGRTWGGE